MSENILNIGGNTIIFNGGEPLPGCPESWEEARQIEDKFNEGTGYDREEDLKEQPVWTFDCGFKLDFDGPLVNVSSRFYPPKSHYGPTWDGTVTISVMGKEIKDQKFDCKTLEELKMQVETYVNDFKDKIIQCLVTP